MTVESKIRSLLVQLDSILNPYITSTKTHDFQCLIRPLPKPITVNTAADKLYFQSDFHIGIKQVFEDRDMGVVDVSPAIERFADKVRGLIPPC